MTRVTGRGRSPCFTASAQALSSLDSEARPPQTPRASWSRGLCPLLTTVSPDAGKAKSTPMADNHCFLWKGKWVSIGFLSPWYEDKWNSAEIGDLGLWPGSRSSWEKMWPLLGQVICDEKLVLVGTPAVFAFDSTVLRFYSVALNQVKQRDCRYRQQPVLSSGHLREDGQDLDTLRISPKCKSTWHPFLLMPLAQKYQPLWKLSL